MATPGQRAPGHRGGRELRHLVVKTSPGLNGPRVFTTGVVKTRLFITRLKETRLQATWSLDQGKTIFLDSYILQGLNLRPAT